MPPPLLRDADALLRARAMPPPPPETPAPPPPFPSELCIRFFSARYHEQPLTITGPLHAKCTVSGVFSDLLAVTRHLGAQVGETTGRSERWRDTTRRGAERSLAASISSDGGLSGDGQKDLSLLPREEMEQRLAPPVTTVVVTRRL